MADISNFRHSSPSSPKTIAEVIKFLSEFDPSLHVSTCVDHSTSTCHIVDENKDVIQHSLQIQLEFDFISDRY